MQFHMPHHSEWATGEGGAGAIPRYWLLTPFVRPVAPADSLIFMSIERRQNGGGVTVDAGFPRRSRTRHFIERAWES